MKKSSQFLSALILCVPVFLFYFFVSTVGIENTEKNVSETQIETSKKTKVNITGAGGNKESYEQKIKKEREILNNERVGEKLLTEQSLYSELKNKNISIEKELAERMRNGSMTFKDYEFLQVLIAQNMSEEENFKVEMSGLKEFSDIKKAYEERSKKTGLFYGNDILNNPRAYRSATARDIIGLINEGGTLPETALLHIIAADNLDLAIELKQAGFMLNVDYFDSPSTMGLMEAQVQLFTWNPRKSSLEKQIESINRLIEIGVPLNTNDGTRDSLDRLLGAAALTKDPDDASRLMAIAAKLNGAGVALQESHLELLDKIKIKYPHAYQLGNNVH